MEKLIVVVVSIATLVFISFLMSWPVMMLWNGCLVDAVNVVKPVGWLQAWGITIMCGLLFKSVVSKS